MFESPLPCGATRVFIKNGTLLKSATNFDQRYRDFRLRDADMLLMRSAELCFGAKAKIKQDKIQALVLAAPARLTRKEKRKERNEWEASFYAAAVELARSRFSSSIAERDEEPLRKECVTLLPAADDVATGD